MGLGGLEYSPLPSEYSVLLNRLIYQALAGMGLVDLVSDLKLKSQQPQACRDNLFERYCIKGMPDSEIAIVL
jgi:hypothetical protein